MPPVAGHEAGEEPAILAVMDRYLQALSTNDIATMASLQTSDGTTYQAVPARGGGVRVVSRPNSFWVEPANAGGKVRERYWSPTVFVRGSIAIVWAPYEFWADGKTSHCGVDVFNFVKAEEGWRIASSMWTVEPDGCASLRPANPASLRPAN